MEASRTMLDRAYINPSKEEDRTKIPPNTFWNIEEAKKNNIYFYLKEIKAVKPHGRVIVEGLGEMIMLGGYSYLGLKEHPKIHEATKQALDEYGAGTDGSRFLAGTFSLHNALEKTIARFKSTEDCITFTSGYLANVSTISTLLRRNDIVFCDKMNHASIIDGCLFSRAHLMRYPYGDLEMLEKYLKKITARVRKLVVVDAVYSMEGTIADLPGIKALCQKYDAYLMVDEAHSVGVLGERGTGIEEYFNMPKDTIDIKMGTLSKAIPSTGGYVAGNSEIINFLKHEARGFLYSGAPSSTAIAAAMAAFQVIEEEPSRIQELNQKAGYFRTRLKEEGFNVGEGQTPIVPIIIGEFTATSLLAKYCQDNGIFIHAIHPPVVTEGSSRLRASITYSNTVEDLDYCVETIKTGARKFGIL
ncbi:aminotransferase class I/II-fold pyridoxal phosphate-dependent enzyme [bacterium]|nr:aminotransferase class I/II-fold pyridoxal phosphate-dependent enzyme [bacterium]